ncbi:MAG TPA: hypothetical protein VFG87_07250 [Amycolatopsis sp.]|jgi:hypothetical protein|nr:hypothetical protein [Amycolatopsis sp.]
MTQPRTRTGRALFRGLLAALLTAACLTTAVQSAQAASEPVLAGLTVTPDTSTVGTGVQVVGTATNTTGSTVTAAMGIDLSGALVSTAVSGNHCTPRHLTTLIYCAVSLPPNASASITFTATARSTGVYDFRSYARIQYATDNSFAYATLTVS